MYRQSYFSGDFSTYTLKAVFQLRVFYTYVHARKSLNPFQYYIWSEQMFWWREFSILYDLACFSDFIC